MDTVADRPFLDRFLPRFDENEVHETTVAASVALTWAAIREVRATDMPLVGLLLGLRRLPARLMGRAASKMEPPRDVPILKGLAAAGFVTLDESPGREVIVGVVGQFWRLSPEPIRLASTDDFLGFSRPGFAKAVMNFEVSEAGRGMTRVRTETRIRGTDDAARRTFARYWRVVHPGSALIRMIWLRAIRLKAEAAEREQRALSSVQGSAGTP